MVEIKVDDSNKISLLSASGDTVTIGAQIAAAVGKLYQVISQTQEDAGETFKETIAVLLNPIGVAWDVKTTGPPDTGGCIVYYPQSLDEKGGET